MPELRLQTQNVESEVMSRCMVIDKAAFLEQPETLQSAFPRRTAFSRILAGRSGASTMMNCPLGWLHKQLPCTLRRQPLVGTVPEPSLTSGHSHITAVYPKCPWGHTLHACPLVKESTQCQPHSSAKHIDKPLSRAGGLTLGCVGVKYEISICLIQKCLLKFYLGGGTQQLRYGMIRWERIFLACSTWGSVFHSVNINERSFIKMEKNHNKPISNAS